MRISPAALGSAMARLGIDSSTASSSGWAAARCPVCASDDKPTLRVNVTNGEYRCFRCGSTSAGDGPDLEQFITSPAAPSLHRTVGDKQVRDLPPLSDDLMSRYHRMLVDSPTVVSDLERKRGWTEATVKRIGIGWDGSHLWLPIRDPSGKLVNARMYDPFKRTNLKSFHYANDEGTKRTTAWVPFGVASLAAFDTVWMFEGEPDGILAAQLGFPTLLITGGSGTWTEEVVSIIENRKVVLCYDRDIAGRKGAEVIRARLTAFDIDSIVLNFPLSDGLKDFSDAILRDNRDSKWFRKVAQNQWEGASEVPSMAKPIPVKLGSGIPKEPISVKAHVLGTHSIPVLVPQMAEARCTMNWGEQCERCPVRAATGTLRVEIEPVSTLLMELSITPLRLHEMVVKKLARIPGRCPVVQINSVGHWMIQHLKLIPPMSDRAGGDSLVRSAMYVTSADGNPPMIRSNQLYHFSGQIEPDVETNEWTLLSAEAVPAEDDVDSFRLDESLVNALRETFSPEHWTVSAIDAMMLQEEKSLARHVTNIFGREVLLRVVDLTYHSVLKFPFRGRMPMRGWLSLLVIGDTRTGKSETMSALSSYFGLGKYIMDPANTTYAGLVGGLQQVGKGDKSWVVTWGLIPTNDRGMVIVDEVSSLSTDDIGKMSGMRSSGIAEITKIRNSSTPARTRLIMAGNPRGLARMLSSYGTAVEATMDLIGTPEDLARFDFAVAVKQGLDKDQADRELGDQPHPAMIELRRALVRFAWSRMENQIEWEEDAEQMAVDIGNRLSKRYDHHLPIVEPSEQDLKVARLAVAAACRTFSVKAEDPNIVYVRRCHVEFAERVMVSCYDGELGYGEYSDFTKRHRLDEKAVLQILANLDPAGVGRTARALLSLRRVHPGNISMVLGLGSEEARALVASLAQNGAAKFESDSRNQSMVWTEGFMNMLRACEKNPPKVDVDDSF